MSETVFLVGGAIRDELLGVDTKDFDFAVEAESFAAMRNMVMDRGGEVFLEQEEFLTIRARDTRGELTGQKKLTADFVMCRKDGTSTDGRRPDWVEPGTIFDDLARRDFTVNAMARNVETGELVDPHGGREDLAANVLRAVGDPWTRIQEDALRAIRAIRFMITKGFVMSEGVEDCLWNPRLHTLLASVSDERKREELVKCFKHDSLLTMKTVAALSPKLQRAMIPDTLWLKPTMEGR